MFQEFLNKHNKIKFLKNTPVIYEVGYPKLDYLRSKKIKIKTSKPIIVIAPSDFRHIKKLSHERYGVFTGNSKVSCRNGPSCG